MSDCITTPTIHQLTEELAGMNDWYSLGVALLVPVSKLKEIITSSPQEGTTRWRIDLLQHWLDSTPTASWSDIITALEKIGHHTLSARLRSKYLSSTTTITTAEQQLSTTVQQSCTTSSVTTYSSPTHPATITATNISTSVDVQPSTPADDVHVSVVYRSDYDDIQAEFIKLFLKVAEIFEKKKSMTPEKLKRYLSKFPELTPHLYYAETMSQVLDVVQEHSSFICCSYLRHAVNYFNLPGAIEAIKNYYTYVDEFCSQTLTRHIYMKPFISTKSIQFAPSTTITFKLGWKPADKTLSDIRDLLEKAFHEQKLYVHIVVVRGGSVKVICVFPQHVMKHLVRLAQVNKEVLVESGVTYLRVGDTIVVDNSGQNEVSLVEDLVLQLTIALQLKENSQHMLMSGTDYAAEDVVRKWAVPCSSVVSDGVTDDGIVHNGYQHTQSVPTSSRGIWQITWNQAEVVLSGKPNGSFLVRERGGKPVYDPSFSSTSTHSISVVVNGRVRHLPIYKKENSFGFLANQQFPSIEILKAYYSRTGFKTADNIPVKLINQLTPDKDTLANLPSDPPPIIQRYTFSDVASLPKHYPHHDERTWFCPLLSKEDSVMLLRGRVNETFLVRATELSEPNHIYTVDVVVQRNVFAMCVYKEGDWLQLGASRERYESINTLVMHRATTGVSLPVGDHVVLTQLRYPVHSSQFYKHQLQ